MKFIRLFLLLGIALFVFSCSSDEDGKCSADNPNGACEGGKVCVGGKCVDKGDTQKCSIENPEGWCEEGTCKNGICVTNEECSEEHPNGWCENSGEFCDGGICKPKIMKYKAGVIAQMIDENHQLTSTYHFFIMDMNGRNKHQITNDAQSCINKDSCWISPNYRYFLFLKDGGNGVYSLNIADIPDNFNTDFANSKLVTNSMQGEPYFLKDGESFIYIDGSGQVPVIKKYNMKTKTSERIANFSVKKQGQDQQGHTVEYDHPAVNFVISPDNKTMVFDIIMDYRDEKNPSEIWKIDITKQDAEPVMIYKFNKLNQDGNGMNWGVISDDNKKLFFISEAGLQHRLHIVNMDGSSLVEDGGDPVGGDGNPLGKYIGPDYNSCSSIEGNQICQMKSRLFCSKDGKYLYFAGKVGKYTDLSPYVNLYKYDVANETLIKITDENTALKDYPFQYVTFNMETQNVVYIMAERGYIKNFDVYYANLNSDLEDLGSKKITSTREARELKFFFLKR